MMVVSVVEWFPDNSDQGMYFGWPWTHVTDWCLHSRSGPSGGAGRTAPRVGGADRVEPVEQPAAGGGDVADDLPAIGRCPLALDQSRLLELVEQPGDRRPLLDHPLAHGERRDPGGPCP